MKSALVSVPEESLHLILNNKRIIFSNRPTNNQILLMEAVHEVRRNEITSVNFFLIEKNPLQIKREFSQKRYATASTVPRTQSFHYFEYHVVGAPQLKRVLHDLSFCKNHNF